MPIIKTIAKGICAAMAILASFMLVMFVIMTICWGPFGSGGDNTANTVDVVPTPEPTAIPEPIESSIREHINIYKSGQDDIVECKRLTVTGNNNHIGIMNSDVERITVMGYGNSIDYSCDANPEIRDYGDYNDVWQRWLT